MKTNILIFITLFFITSLSASEWREKCATEGKLAEQIMTKRQAGVSIIEMIESVPEGSMDEKLIILAFEVRTYNSDRVKNIVVGDFRDRTYLGCAKGMMKQN